MCYEGAWICHGSHVNTFSSVSDLFTLQNDFHNTDRHDNSDGRPQDRDDNKLRRPRPGQQNGPHNINRSAHATIATTQISTTQMGAYVPETHAPSATNSAVTTEATSTSFVTLPHPSLPPVGIGYSFIAAPSISIATQPVDFTAIADSGACSHFIDNQLLPSVELKMNHYVHLNQFNVGGNHRLYGVGQ